MSKEESDVSTITFITKCIDHNFNFCVHVNYYGLEFSNLYVNPHYIPLATTRTIRFFLRVETLKNSMLKFETSIYSNGLLIDTNSCEINWKYSKHLVPSTFSLLKL